MRAISPHVAYISLIALTAAACGEPDSASDLNPSLTQGMPTGSDTSGVAPTTPMPQTTTPGVVMGTSGGPMPPTPDTTGVTTTPGPDVVAPTPGVSDPVPTTTTTTTSPEVPDTPSPDTTLTPTEPTSVAPVTTEPVTPDEPVVPEDEGMGGAGNIDPVEPVDPIDPPPPDEPITEYSPREGSFKMLVYFKTAGFPHTGSIDTGKVFLQEIADEQGFEIKLTDTNEDITFEGLSQYEIVFFLNSTGDIFNNQEQDAYEQWMTEKNGAFAGVHSATDTENGWAFYSDVTGQYYSGHGNQGTQGQIQFQDDMLDFPAVAGLPNPWSRQEEWYNFDQHQNWSAKPGFMILGRKAADGQPITWAREWGNFRAFYTAIGHDAAVFRNDDEVKKHLTGGIMWAVRREHLIK